MEGSTPPHKTIMTSSTDLSDNPNPASPSQKNKTESHFTGQQDSSGDTPVQKRKIKVPKANIKPVSGDVLLEQVQRIFSENKEELAAVRECIIDWNIINCASMTQSLKEAFEWGMPCPNPRAEKFVCRVCPPDNELIEAGITVSQWTERQSEANRQKHDSFISDLIKAGVLLKTDYCPDSNPGAIYVDHVKLAPEQLQTVKDGLPALSKSTSLRDQPEEEYWKDHDKQTYK